MSTPEAKDMDFTVKLPLKHAQDWFSRYDEEDAEDVAYSDALYYAECMGPDSTGDIDYRPAARACLRGIDRAGVKYSARGVLVTVHGIEGKP